MLPKDEAFKVDAKRLNKAINEQFLEAVPHAHEQVSHTVCLLSRGAAERCTAWRNAEQPLLSTSAVHLVHAAYISEPPTGHSPSP